MKPGLILPLFPILLAMYLFAGGVNAEAADGGVRISVGGGRHRPRAGGVIEYRTVDPGYTTWYPSYTTTYDYPTVYRSDTYYDSYYTPYVYSSPSVDFGVWFGTDGRRHYGHRHHHRR